MDTDKLALHLKEIHKALAEKPTLRDQFAMAALTGLMGTKDGQEVVFEAAEMHGMEPIDVAAVTAYAQADAMLAARQPRKEKD